MNEIKCPLMDSDVIDFKCANASIEQQISESYFPTLMKQAYAHQIILDKTVIGYYMLHFKRIKLDDINEIYEEDYESNFIDYYMAMHIKYLAIDERLQHKGIGTRILQSIIIQILRLSKEYPIRIITIDALSEYYDWYRKIGFKDIPGRKFDGNTYPMFMDCMSEDDYKRLKSYCENYW
jgi:GNAT superfamily N-acetyltransferase